MAAVETETIADVAMNESVVTSVTVNANLTSAASDNEIPTSKSVIDYIKGWWESATRAGFTMLGKLTASGGIKASAPIEADAGVTGDVTGDLTGNADTATKLKTARTFKISSSDGSGETTGTDFDGSSGPVTLQLPDTIKATIDGSASSCSGNAATSTGWSKHRKVRLVCASIPETDPDKYRGEAVLLNGLGEDPSDDNILDIKLPEKLTSETIGTAETATTAGQLSTGTKFTVTDGTNVATTEYGDGRENYTGTENVTITLNQNYSGNAASATKLETARNFSIASSDGSDAGDTTSFNGTGNAELKLPKKITASLTGHASMDLPLTGGNITADNLTVNNKNVVRSLDGFTAGADGNVNRPFVQKLYGTFYPSDSSDQKLAHYYKVADFLSPTQASQSVRLIGRFGEIRQPGTLVDASIYDYGTFSTETGKGTVSCLARIHKENSNDGLAFCTIKIYRDASTGVCSVYLYVPANTYAAHYNLMVSYATRAPYGGYVSSSWTSTPPSSTLIWTLSNDNSVKYYTTADKVAAATTAESCSGHAASDLALTGGTVTGTVAFTNTSGVSTTTPSVIVGGENTSTHLSLDFNSMQARSNATTTTTLKLNPIGGNVVIGTANATTTVKGTISGTLSGNATSATQLETARNLTIKDSAKVNSGTAASFNGTAAIDLTMPSTICTTSVDGMHRNCCTGGLAIAGGTANAWKGNGGDGARLVLYGKSEPNGAGAFDMRAMDGSNESSLKGTPAGALTWKNKNVITAATTGVTTDSSGVSSITASSVGALPLSGGDMTGAISLYSSNYGSNRYTQVGIGVGTSYNKTGASLVLRGKNFSTTDAENNAFLLFCPKDDANSSTVSLIGRKTGQLTWNGSNIVRGVKLNGTSYTAGTDGIVSLTSTTGLPSTGTMTGQLILSSTNGVSSGSNPLVVGGTKDKPHLDFDFNSMQARSNATTTTTLKLNPIGSNVEIGTSSSTTTIAGKLTVTGTITGVASGCSKTVNSKELTSDITLTADDVDAIQKVAYGSLTLVTQSQGTKDTAAKISINVTSSGWYVASLETTKTSWWHTGLYVDINNIRIYHNTAEFEDGYSDLRYTFYAPSGASVNVGFTNTSDHEASTNLYLYKIN